MKRLKDVLRTVFTFGASHRKELNRYRETVARLLSENTKLSEQL